MENANDLKEALEYIGASNLTYQEWVSVGMGMKQAGYTVQAWEQWSSRDPDRYHRGECAKKWESFKGSASPITENSIFKLAYDHGWSGPAGHELDWNDTITGDQNRPTDGVLIDKRWVEGREFEVPEEWNPADQLTKYLQALFEPTENVGYVTHSWKKDGKWMPDQGNWDRTAGQLIEALAQIGPAAGPLIPRTGAMSHPSRHHHNKSRGGSTTWQSTNIGSRS